MSTYVRPAPKYILLVLVNNTGVSQRGDRDDVCVSSVNHYFMKYRLRVSDGILSILYMEAPTYYIMHYYRYPQK